MKRGSRNRANQNVALRELSVLVYLSQEFLLDYI